MLVSIGRYRWVSLTLSTRLSQPPGRAAAGPVKDPFLPVRTLGHRARAVGPRREGEGGAGEGRWGAGRGRRPSAVESLLPTLLERSVRTGVRSGSDRLRVLGGRGALVDEEDLPDLSDSGDEAAWEDEDEAELPHDKQQTPCLFCDRFVQLCARLQPRGPSRVRLRGLESEWPALEFSSQRSGVRAC